MRYVTTGLLGLALALAGVQAAEAALPHYMMSVLGPGWANGMNNNGQVVGVDGSGLPAVWQNGAAQNLAAPSDASYSPSALSINDSGQVAGYYGSNADYLQHCIYWTSPTDQPQEVPNNADYNVQPFGINNSGQIVGEGISETPGAGGQRAFVWQIGSSDPPQYLTASSEGECAATAINNNGQIVGLSGDGTVLWSPEDGYSGRQGIGSGYAYSLNNHGQVAWEDSNADSWVWQNGANTAVAHGFTPNCINDSGVIVGPAGMQNSNGDWVAVAAVWSSDSGVKNLNSLVVNLPAGTNLFYDSAINNNGQIVAMANGNAYLLDPVTLIDGDANMDGKVDINDLSRVLTNYDKTGMAWADGDFNGDGKVDINDLSMVLANYDKSLGASAGVKAVPEPGALALSAAGLLGLLAYACRKRT